MTFEADAWALILGGSSGFGLATAHKVSRHGMNVCVVHRDRRGAMPRIEREFDAIRGNGVRLLTFNADALDTAERGRIVAELASALAATGRVRVLLHSIALGNLKLMAPERPAHDGDTCARLAGALGIDAAELAATVDRLFAEGAEALHTIASRPAYPTATVLDDEDMARTIYSMGTSLLSWTQELLQRNLLARDARVFGLTSEGNQIAWKGYAAVAAAKVALESIVRGMAVELAPYGVRANVIQAGVTDTPALRLIPGSAHLKAHARLRNPFGRLTTPEDVADVIYLLARDEAAWINGEIIRVDGGEHISGAMR
jgi:NAD(P)-dependent dehydrogenase (short-subunit alcohol dehydrogenase family)